MQAIDIQPAVPPANPAALRGIAPQAAPEHCQYLTFSLGEELFAIGILAVREIIEYGQVTEVPMTPPFIRGVINLRGAVVPVVDLAVRFGRAARDITKRTCIVIIEMQGEQGRQELGIVVDAVSEVLEIAGSDIEPPPTLGATIRTEFMDGMGKVNGRFVVILNASQVLSMEEAAVLANLGGVA